MSNLEERLDELRVCLEQLHYPPLNDRSEGVRKIKHDVGTKITVAILSRAPPQMATLLEGARVHRESVFLVLDVSWLEKRDNELYLKKGVWMDFSTKQSFLDTYVPERRVTYFANIITAISSFGEQNDGEDLVRGATMPKSLDVEFEHFINDKLWIRALLLKNQMSFPDTVGFSRSEPGSKRFDIPKGQRLRIVYVPEVDSNLESRVRKAVAHFVAMPRRSASVVVKLGGPSRQRGVHIWYMPITTPDAIIEKIVALLAKLPPGDSVLLEEYLRTMPSRKVTTHRSMALQPSAGPSMINVQQVMALQEAEEEDEPWAMEFDKAADAQLAFFCRVVTALDGRGDAVASTCACGVVPANTPLNRNQEVLPCSLSQVLRMWGIADEDEIEKTRKLLFREAERVHNAISNEPCTGERAPDIIAVDMILALKNSVVVPYIYRVHDHDSLAFSQKLDLILNDPGRSVRGWVECMLFRSQDYVMRGRCVLIVGGGGFGKLELWEIMESLGIRSVLADQNGNHCMKDRVWKFIHVPELSDHSRDAENAKLVIEKLEEAGIRDEIDGVTTTYDPCVVVAAFVAEFLGKHGNGGAIHDRAKDKYKLARFLKDQCRPTHDTVSASLFVAESIEVGSGDDVRTALSPGTAKLTLPAVLKNTHGMCGMGVKLVSSVEQAVHEFESMDAALKSDLDSDWTGLSFDGNVFLMEYLDGTEHDVDICMFNGELVVACVTDNGPTRLPYFNETCAAMPSLRHADEVQSLIAGAYQCCKAAGLHSGVYNVEMKYTSKGPRLIEINARLGGFYLTNWAQRVFNVNLVRCVMQVACGIRPVVPAVIPPTRSCCVGLQLYNGHHGKALRKYVPENEEILTYQERFEQNRFRQLDKDGSLIWISMMRGLGAAHNEWEGAYANIGCEAPTHAEAAAKLLTAVSCFGIDDDSSLKTDYFVTGLGIKVNKPNIFASS